MSMNDKKPDPQRRQTLKKILAGSSVVGASTVVPDAWVKPVVDAVVLPAHAQASLVMLPLNAAWAGGSSNGIIGVAPGSKESLAQRLLDQIVPEARAGNEIVSCRASVLLCLNTVSADQVSVQLSVNGLVQGIATATVVNRIIKQPFTVGDYTVTGILSDDGQTWTGRVMGPCPTMEDNVSVIIEYSDLDVGYTAVLNAPCGVANAK
jgi:hypothetical protein